MVCLSFCLVHAVVRGTGTFIGARLPVLCSFRRLQKYPQHGEANGGYSQIARVRVTILGRIEEATTTGVCRRCAATRRPRGRRPFPPDPPHPASRRPGERRPFPPDPPYPATRRLGGRWPSSPDPSTPQPGGPPTPTPSSQWQMALALRRSQSPCRSFRRPGAALFAETLRHPDAPPFFCFWTASRCAARGSGWS